MLVSTSLPEELCISIVFSGDLGARHPGPSRTEFRVPGSEISDPEICLRSQFRESKVSPHDAVHITLEGTGVHQLSGRLAPYPDHASPAASGNYLQVKTQKRVESNRWRLGTLRGR